MNISDVIKHMEKIRIEHGDLEVIVRYDCRNYGECSSPPSDINFIYVEDLEGKKIIIHV